MNSQIQTSERRDAQTRQTAPQEQGREQPFVVPPVDVFENESGITLLADLPGVSRDRLGVRVDGDSLVIEATASTAWPQEMQLVYGETGSAVRMVIVNGEIVVEDGRPTRLDVRALVAEAAERGNRLAARIRPALADVSRLEPYLRQAYLDLLAAFDARERSCG